MGIDTEPETPAAAAWFGIADQAEPGVAQGVVPLDWPLLPSGLTLGDKFRLLYVTRAVIGGQFHTGDYRDHVRAEITGNALKSGGVPELVPIADTFHPIIAASAGRTDASRRDGTDATEIARFGADDPDDPIYWVGGAKVADNKADFTDGTWDDEADPRHADGSSATVSTAGYWTGTLSTGKEQDYQCPGHTNRGRASPPRSFVNVGYLNDSNAVRTPLGPTAAVTGCSGAASHGSKKPLYALSGVLTVVGGATVSVGAAAAEGSPVTFTVTIPNAAPSGGITVPFTLSDGRGVTGDPAYAIATGASGGTGADYDNDPGTVTIPANAASATFTVATTQDSTYEGDHYFTVTLGTPTGTNPPPVHPTQGSAIGIIEDDADLPTVQFDPASVNADEETGTATVTVTRTGTTLVPSSVVWTTADGTGASGATHPGDYTSATGTVGFSATDTSQTFTIDITADSVAESAETFTVTLSEPVDAALGSDATATVAVTDDSTAPGPAVTAAITTSGGDSDGNIVENASDGSEYLDVTITLDRALTGAETVNVDLTFQGAQRDDAYTVALEPSSQAGVALGSGQNPRVTFTAGASSAVVRVTAADNAVRTQPRVVITAAASVTGPTPQGASIASGSPVAFTIIDDETGDIEVPPTFGIFPSGISGGDDFRLLFRTSPAYLTAATSTDIADYDAFVQDTLAVNGHEAIKPYAGFFKVLGTTRSGSGSTGATARFHNGLVTTGEHNDHHDGANDEWADGSKRSTRGTVATPVYWLNGSILANNYADLCDIDWTGSPGVSNGFDQDDPRSEDGTQNIPDGNVTNARRYEPWTGSGNACEAWNHPLGANTVSRGGHSAGDNLLHAAAAANTQERPLLGLSPVFVRAEVPAVSFNSSSAFLDESRANHQILLSVTPAPDAPLTVNYTVAQQTVGSNIATAGEDFVAVSAGTITIAANATSGTIPVTIIADDIHDPGESFQVRLLPGSGYDLGAPRAIAAIIRDDDPLLVTLDEAAYVELENVGTVAVPFTLNGSPTSNQTFTLSFSGGDATGASGGTGADYDNGQLSVTVAPGSSTGTFNVPITDDSAQEGDEWFNATLGKPAAVQWAPSAVRMARVTILDDDTPQGVSVTPSGGLTVDEGNTSTYTVRLTQPPTGSVTVTITGAANGITFDTDPDTDNDQDTLTFTTSNWFTPQTVTVGSATDTDTTANTATLTHTPSGGGYTSSHAATLTVSQNDLGTGAAPELTFASTTYSITEGTNNADTVTLTVNASGAPFTDLPVTVSTTGPNVGDLNEGRTQRSFNIRAGQTSGTFNLGIKVDRILEDDETVTVTLNDPGDGSYTIGTPGSTTLTIHDSDQALVNLASAEYLVLEDGSEGQGTATADGTLAVTVELDIPDGFLGGVRPVSLERDVPLTLTMTDGTAVGTSGGTGADYDNDAITFSIPSGTTAASARDPIAHTVKIPITDDSAAESDEAFTFALSVGPSAQVGINLATDTAETPLSATVTILDDDSPDGLVFYPASGFAVDEGATATYTVRLRDEPSAGVTVTVTGAGSGIAIDTDPDMAGVQNTLTFTAANWYIPQEVTVTSTPDANAVDEMVTLQHAPSGGGYSSAQNADFTATANDSAVVVSIGLPRAEGEGRDAQGRQPVDEGEAMFGFNVTATPQQTADLTVCVRVTETLGDRVTAANEGVKAVTILANSSTRVHTVNWTSGMSDAPDSVITVEAVPPNTAGCTGAGSYAVAPGTTPSDPQPSSAIVVRDAQATDVNLASADMTMGEGDATDTAVVTVTLSRALVGSEVIEVPLGLATSTGARLPGSTNGGSANHDFTVSVSGTGVTSSDLLTAAPKIVFTGQNGQTVQTATLTFTPVSGRADGDSASESVTVSLTDDGSGAIASPNMLTNVHGGATGVEAGTNNSITLTVDDNVAPGSPGVTVSPTDLRILENGSATYTIVLNTQPTADVTLSITRAGQNLNAAAVSPTSHTFTAASGANSWDTPLTVTVTGNDEANRNRHRDDFKLEHDFGGSDTTYGGNTYDFTKIVPVGDAPEIEVWETWRGDPQGNRITDLTLRRPETVTSKPGVIPSQDIVANALSYLVTVSSRPTSTVTVNVTVNDPNLVGIALTRNGTPQASLTLTFEDRDPDPGCHYNYHHKDFYYDNEGNVIRDGSVGEDYDNTPDTSWKCARHIYVFSKTADNVNGCTDIIHTVSGGGARTSATSPHAWAAGLMRAHVVAGGGNWKFICDSTIHKATGSVMPVVPTRSITVPSTRVSGLSVNADDSNTATASWTAVPHATEYNVRYEAISYNGAGITPRWNRRYGRATVTGASWTFTHNVPVSSDIVVYVTPVYKPASRSDGVWEQVFTNLASKVTHTVTRGSPQMSAVPNVPTAAPADLQISYDDAATATVAWDAVQHATSYYVQYEGYGDDPRNDVLGAANGLTATSWTFTHSAAEQMLITVTVTPQYVDDQGVTQRLHVLSSSIDLDLANPPCDHTDAIKRARAAYAWHIATAGPGRDIFWQILDYLDADPMPTPPGNVNPGPATLSVIEAYADGKTWEGWEPILDAVRCAAVSKPPQVSITAGSGVTEGGTATFTITADPAPSAPLDVDVTVAAAGDYGVSAGAQTVTVPTSGSTTLTVSTTDDSTDEPDGSVTATVDTGNGYTVSTTAGAATVAVADDDPAPVPDNDDDDPPAPVCVPSLPSDAVTVSEVTGWRNQFSHAEHQQRWDRVLAALGVDTGEAAMTADDARTIKQRYDNTRWDRTVRTLDAIEQCAASTDTPDPVVPPPPPPPPTPEVSIAAGSGVTEGTSATFTLTANPAPNSPLSVTVHVTQSGDFGVATGSQTVTIPTTGTATLTVTTANDSTDEADGSVTVTLGAGAGYTVSATAGAATVAVTDDDDAPPPPPPPDPEVSITAGSGVTEGGDAVFTLTADPAPAAPLTVDVTVAQAGDFGVSPGSQTVTIPATGTATLTVATTNDSTDEADGSVAVTVDSGAGYTVSATAAAATVAVADDDDPPPEPVNAAPSLSISDATAAEGGTAVFTVTLSPSSGRYAWVHYYARPAYGQSRSAGYSDFASTYGMLTFKPGETAKTISVPLTDDGLSEGTETFRVVLYSPAQVDISNGEAIGTITDND